MKSTLYSLAVVLLLSACGGGEVPVDPPAPPPPPPPPAGTIGTAGGVVQGTGGAQVTVPAGALTQNLVIAVTQSASGAPALPADIIAVGQIHAFTPHGTAFAAPVTMTVPFDPALIPTGATPALYKTNAAQTAWEAVAGATISGNVMSGSVNGFSFAVVGVPPPAPPAPSVQSPPFRTWWFTEHRADDSQVGPPANTLDDGPLLDSHDFGPLVVMPTGRDDRATGEIFSNSTGRTYWVESEAPVGNLSVPTNTVGAEAHLFQEQFYRKRRSDASLRFKITEAWIEALDYNAGGPAFSRCPWADEQGPEELCLDELLGELTFSLALIQLETEPGEPPLMLRSAHQGTLRFWGSQSDWRWSVDTAAAYHFIYSGNSGRVDEVVAPSPIFNEEQFDFEFSGSGLTGTSASMHLRDTVTVEVDISAIPVGAAFWIDNTVNALSHNRRGRESYIAARLRDPVSANGLEWEIDGLDVIEPIEIGGPIFIEQPECVAPGATPESGTVQFNAATYYLPEFRHSSRKVRVTRTGGSAGKVLVRVTTSDGTALAGTHYEPVTQTIVFGDGDTQPRAIEVPIVNDTSYSGPHQFNLSLTPVGNCANLGARATAVVNILDDETPPPATYDLRGSITGLTGSGLTIDDGVQGEDLHPEAGATSFVFNYDYHPGLRYNVRVLSQPTNPLQICSVSNGSGTFGAADVTNVAVTCTTPAASGSLDASFGDNGKVTGVLAGGAKRLRLLPDGRILVLGDRALRRFNSDGSDDSTFGIAGEAAVTFSGNSNEAFDLAVQPDGRILVVGTTRVGSNFDFAVSRFNADGTPDTSFGTSGSVFTDFSGAVDRAHAVLIQPDGAIVVAGHKALNGIAGIDNDFAVARYTTDGVLDTTFGTAGRASINIAGLADLAATAALQPDGAIVLAGRVGESGGGTEDVGLARFNADGTADTTFGNQGTVRIDYAAGGSDQAIGVIVQTDGRIVIAGAGSFGGTSEFLVARLNANGSRDDTFGSTGFVSLPFGTQQDFANAVALQPDGTILVAGQASSTTVSDFGLARLRGDGTLDEGFGTGGRLSIDFFGSGDIAEALAVQSDGKIVVAGGTRNGSGYGLGLARVSP